MQLNTLNRVIALFLIGGFVVAIIAVVMRDEIGDVLKRYSENGLGASAAIFLAVALLSITALAGSVVDAIGNVTVRGLIKRLARKRSRSFLFCCAREFDEQERWLTIFKDALDSSAHKALAQQEPEMIRTLSAGIFFRTAKKEFTEWLIQHHSMYHLSANFVVVLVVGVIWSCVERSYYVAFGSFVSAYLLTSFSLDNYLYTYQLSLRNGYLALKDLHDGTPAPSEGSS